MFLLSPYYASSQEPDDADTLIEDLELLIEYLNLAESYYLENEIQTALSFYDNALEIDPSSIDALNGKANILNEIGQYEEAITYYNQVLEIDPSDIDALNGKANSLNALENHQEAITYYDKVLEMDSVNILALNGKALALESLGNVTEAVLLLEQIIELSEIEPTEEPQIVEENSPDLNNETFQGLDQTLIVIVGVFVVILGVIITLDLLVRKRTKKQSLEKSN